MTSVFRQSRIPADVIGHHPDEFVPGPLASHNNVWPVSDRTVYWARLRTGVPQGPQPAFHDVYSQSMYRSTVCQVRTVACLRRSKCSHHVSGTNEPKDMQANPRRVAKVTKLIEREIGSLMQTDNVLMDITKPRSTSGDVRGTLCSCTGVHVTSDLQVVKVYVSVFTADAAAKQHTLARLKGLSGCAAALQCGALLVAFAVLTSVLPMQICAKVDRGASSVETDSRNPLCAR